MKIIGISGLAGAGKDLFFELCKEELSKKNFNSCRVALADELKEECKEACLELFDIDPLNCDRQQKDKIRDFLVFFGLTKRLETEGTHWTSKANLKIKELSDNCSVHNVPNPVCFVTDIRYAKYPKDEHRWIKDQDGLLVHLRKRDIVWDEDFNFRTKYDKPINKQEATNDPQVRKEADVCIEWPNCKGDIDRIDTFLKPVVKDFIDQYIAK